MLNFCLIKYKITHKNNNNTIVSHVFVCETVNSLLFCPLVAKKKCSFPYKLNRVRNRGGSAAPVTSIKILSFFL